MKCNFINIKVNNKKILELFKLSLGNDVNSIYYNKNKKKCSNKKLEVTFYKKFIKKNIGKMIYEETENKKEIKIFNQNFILNNKKRAKIIIDNKQYKLKEAIKINKIFKIKIKFLDLIIKLNSMFENCESLSYVNNFQNFNTKYLRGLYNLFSKCSSLLYIDDISNWNITNINNISRLFYDCSSLKELPDISKWNISYVNNINSLFEGCSSLERLPDISKWNISNINSINRLFIKISNF